RQLPNVDWTRGATAFVQTPTLLVGFMGGAEAGPAVRGEIEDDLRTAGLRIVPQQYRGELQIMVGAGSKLDSMDGYFRVTVDKDGERIDHFEVNFYRLPCWPSIRDAEASRQCVAREIAVRVLESKAIAEAAKKKSRPPPAAVATRGSMTGK